jgi:hypothetical protein
MKNLRDRVANNLMDDVHLSTTSAYSPYGAIGTSSFPIMPIIPNETAYARNFGPILPGPQVTSYIQGDRTVLVHNTGTGVAFPQPLIIPGIGPNNSTTVVQTNPVRFNDDTPITTNTMILPGGQPFIPTASSFLPGTL